MTTETTVTAIMQSETFQITARALANQLHIPLQNAIQELIIEIVEHRHSLDDVAQRLNGKQRSEIVFAKKDLVRKQHKADNAYMKLFTADTDADGNSIIDNTEATPATPASAYSDDEINRALTVIPMAFTDTTASFITDVLVKGSEATKASRNMSTSQFNKKVKQTIATAKDGNARKKLNKLLKSDTRLRLEENQQLAKSFIQMINDDAPKEWITKALQDMMNIPYFDEAFDACDYQGKVVKFWDTPETRQDCYKFINEVYKLTGDNKQ